MGKYTTEEVSPSESTKQVIKRKRHAESVVRTMQSGIVMYLRVEVFRKNGVLQRS